jgi:uncharacterized protein (DUF2062 family)
MMKFFKKEKKLKKESSGLNLNSYWQTAVCSLFVVVILLSIFGYSLFMSINKEPAVIGGESGKVETVKKERISNVLEYFSLREQKSSEIFNSPAPIVDPSL